MLYNKDPIMPFQHADWLKHAVVTDDELSDEYDSDATEIYDPEASTKILNSTDPLLSTIQNLENQWKQIFDKAHKSIKKAQIHQGKQGITTGKQKVHLLRLMLLCTQEKFGAVGVQGTQVAQTF